MLEFGGNSGPLDGVLAGDSVRDGGRAVFGEAIEGGFCRRRRCHCAGSGRKKREKKEKNKKNKKKKAIAGSLD